MKLPKYNVGEFVYYKNHGTIVQIAAVDTILSWSHATYKIVYDVFEYHEQNWYTSLHCEEEYYHPIPLTDDMLRNVFHFEQNENEEFVYEDIVLKVRSDSQAYIGPKLSAKNTIIKYVHELQRLLLCAGKTELLESLKIRNKN